MACGRRCWGRGAHRRGGRLIRLVRTSRAQCDRYRGGAHQAVREAAQAPPPRNVLAGVTTHACRRVALPPSNNSGADPRLRRTSDRHRAPRSSARQARSCSTRTAHPGHPLAAVGSPRSTAVVGVPERPVRRTSPVHMTTTICRNSPTYRRCGGATHGRPSGSSGGLFDMQGPAPRVSCGGRRQLGLQWRDGLRIAARR